MKPFLFSFNILLILIIAFLLKVDNIRSEVYSQLVLYLGSAKIAFVGDSLTRRNSDLAMLVGGISFHSKNFAVDGYTIQQIRRQLADVVTSNRPCLVVVMAGTNRQEDDSLLANIQSYQSMLASLTAQNISVMVMETLLTDNRVVNNYITQLNANLKKYALDKNIVYFPSNAYLSDDHVLIRQFSLDGVHLNQAGYETLNQQLLPYIKQNYISRRRECNDIF
jgi:lysophospholipase L1-like esterase